MRAKTAEELETENTLPLYRVESTTRHSRWHVRCKLCGREGDTYTHHIKTYRCECRKKQEPLYTPKPMKDTEGAEKDRIRQRDYHRLQREGLIPEGCEVHHMKYHHCPHALIEAVIEDILFLTPEQHEQWHREHPDFKGEIV